MRVQEIVDVMHGLERTIGEITFEVEHRDVRLSLFEIRSLNRIKEQIDDLLALDRRGS